MLKNFIFSIDIRHFGCYNTPMNNSTEDKKIYFGSGGIKESELATFDAASPWKAMGLEAASPFVLHFHCGQVTISAIFGRI